MSPSRNQTLAGSDYTPKEPKEKPKSVPMNKEKKVEELKMKPVVETAPMSVEERRKKLRFLLPDGPAAQEAKRKKAIFAQALLRRISDMSVKYRTDNEVC